MRKLLLFMLLAGMLCSCAGLHQASFDHAFANAVIRNDTRGVFANCNAQNASFPLNGTPPIYYAASYGNEDAIDLLFNHGASLRARSPDGRSLVYAAAANGHIGTAQKLLALNAGTQAELSAGAAAHRQQQAAAAQARKLQAAALAWLFVAMTSGSGGNDSGWKCGMCGTTDISSKNGVRQECNRCTAGMMVR